MATGPEGAGGGRAYALGLWLTAMAILAAGIYLTRTDFLGEEWISRSGCLVVALGIWSGVGGLVRERVALEAIDIRRRLSRSALRRRYRHDPEDCEARVAALEKAFDARAASVSRAIEFSVGALEASLLVTGTLVWGFGDLLRFVWER